MWDQGDMSSREYLSAKNEEKVSIAKYVYT